MEILKDVLIETGGFSISSIDVQFSSCCDDLIPDAIRMFYNNVSDKCSRNKLTLAEAQGEVQGPTVVANIVKIWRTGSEVSGQCEFSPHRISRHHEALQALFTKPNVSSVTLKTNRIGDDTLQLLSHLLSSSSSSVRDLSLRTYGGSEMDKALASVLETNESLTSIHLGNLNEQDSWPPSNEYSEMLRAMRDFNCTLGDGVRIDVHPEVGRACIREIHLYSHLNKHGRGLMRSMPFPPQKIPTLLESAGRAEYRGFGRYIYPLLRDNPSKWIGNLPSRQCERSSNQDCSDPGKRCQLDAARP